MEQQTADNIQTIEQRVEIVNQIIEAIKTRGRHFFKAKREGKKDGHFLLKDGKLYWHEEYRNKPMRLTARNRHLFSHGGTLWDQVVSFASFIELGIPRKCINSVSWGYSEKNITEINDLARSLGYLRPEEPITKESKVKHIKCSGRNKWYRKLNNGIVDEISMSGKSAAVKWFDKDGNYIHFGTYKLENLAHAQA